MKDTYTGPERRHLPTRAEVADMVAEELDERLAQTETNLMNHMNHKMGVTTWGPWTMAIPKALLTQRDQISFLEVIGHHRCHLGWNQETLYGVVRMEELP